MNPSIPAFDGIEIETAPNPVWSVIWLHGLGADGHDFEPIVPELVMRDWPPLRFVFPHAPVRPVTINGGMPMRAWYDISHPDLGQQPDEAGIRASARLVDNLIARENARGIASEHILLAGFSQGGVIVLSAGLRHPQRLGGIIALSTYLPLTERLETEAAEIQSGLPIFMAHGTQDPIVAPARAEAAHNWLTRHGYRVQRRTYPMPHSVSAAEITDLKRWLQALFQ